MFGKQHKPTETELLALISQGVKPEIFAPQLYMSAIGKYYLNTDIVECALARKFGATLKSTEEINAFYEAVTPEEKGDVPHANRSRWITLTAQVARGYLKGVGVKTAEEAITLSRHLRGHDERELIKQAVPLLKENEQIVSFACALWQLESFMILAIALGYVPVNTFDEAVKAHKERLRLEEEQRQRNVAM